MKKSAALMLFILILFTGSAIGKADPVLKAAKAELDKSMKVLSQEDTPPYFISYGISDTRKISITSSFGRIKTDNDTRSRILDIDMRVGDYKFDNTHIIRGQRFSFGGGRNYTALPIENDEKAIRKSIWFLTDQQYKKATETLEKARTNQAVKIKEEDTSADFSHERAYQYIEDNKEMNIDIDKFRKQLKELSAIFMPYQWLYIGELSFFAEIQTKYFVSSEGAELKWPENRFRIYVNVKTKAEDGMSLPLYKSYFSFTPDGLPDFEIIKNDLKKLISTLDQLRKAPMLEDTYSGPAILSGEASGVFFHEIFGHRVEGHREKDPNSSQTFKNSVGKKILPDFIDVIMDPTIKTIRGREISGFYPYDDEGIEAQKVVVADNGKFNSFLMSRSPIENFDHSNGHGRRSPGHRAVSRQSNLIVNADETVSREELTAKLREMLKEENKEWGLYFEQVQGGFTFTGRSIPNAFNVNPLLVYKVYADGRPDEMVRGVDLIGTPLATFANITMAADDLGVFNGICGAESGGVPVSACSPSLLVSLIEVQKKAKSQAKLPILDAPVPGKDQ